jgi:hypothetical protein
VNKEQPQPSTVKFGIGSWLLFGTLAVILLATMGAVWYVLSQGTLPAITIHGWVAMGLGVFFSLIIGCGLMWLSFYSDREGFDKRADPGRFPTQKDKD